MKNNTEGSQIIKVELSNGQIQRGIIVKGMIMIGEEAMEKSIEAVQDATFLSYSWFAPRQKFRRES